MMKELDLNTLTREQKINVIVGDLSNWLERDPYSFWEHLEELEAKDLRTKSDKDIEDILIEVEYKGNDEIQRILEDQYHEQNEE